MKAASYFGMTTGQPDGTICVVGDARFDPNLRYRENSNGDYEPAGPRLCGNPKEELANLKAIGGVDDVPTITCTRCEQRIAKFSSEHPCFKVLREIRLEEIVK